VSPIQPAEVPSFTKPIPDPALSAMRAIVDAFNEARSSRLPTEVVEISFPLDGFRVESVRLRGELIELGGTTVDGLGATRLVHPHHLDLQIVIRQASEPEAGPDREIGYHTSFKRAVGPA